MKFTELIEKCIKEHDLNKSSLAELLEIDRSTVNKWFNRANKNGDYTVPDQYVSEKIIEKLGVNPQDLAAAIMETKFPWSNNIFCPINEETFDITGKPIEVLDYLQRKYRFQFNDDELETFTKACAIFEAINKRYGGTFINLRDISLFLSEQNYFDNNNRACLQKECQKILNDSCLNWTITSWFEKEYYKDVAWENNFISLSDGSKSFIEGKHNCRNLRNILLLYTGNVARFCDYSIPVRRCLENIGGYFFNPVSNQLEFVNELYVNNYSTYNQPLFQKNDIIVEIEGHKLSDYSKNEIITFLEYEQNHRAIRNVKVIRDGKIKKFISVLFEDSFKESVSMSIISRTSCHWPCYLFDDSGIDVLTIRDFDLQLIVDLDKEELLKEKDDPDSFYNKNLNEETHEIEGEIISNAIHHYFKGNIFNQRVTFYDSITSLAVKGKLNIFSSLISFAFTESIAERENVKKLLGGAVLDSCFNTYRNDSWNQAACIIEGQMRLSNPEDKTYPDFNLYDFRKWFCSEYMDNKNLPYYVNTAVLCRRLKSIDYRPERSRYYYYPSEPRLVFTMDSLKDILLALCKTIDEEASIVSALDNYLCSSSLKDCKYLSLVDCLASIKDAVKDNIRLNYVFSEILHEEI